jgi:6-phosphogluconolactonase (cycloisomerase 2 family)
VKNRKNRRSRIVAFTTTLTLMCTVNLFAASGRTAPPPWHIHILVTNDDVAANSATVYKIQTDGTLLQDLAVPTRGTGLGIGYFATQRINLVGGYKVNCIYVTDSGSNDIATIEIKNLTLIGRFKGSSSDSGNADGIGVTSTAKYVYASFTGSNTIGTFKVEPACRLRFMNDVPALGLNGGIVAGMKAHGNILVVAYGDGSIESFDISQGTPKSNHDAQNSSGYPNGDLPTGVDISEDGHFAIFGDSNTTASVVEVSDISGGTLAPTVVYTVGSGVNSDNIWLSPDTSLLYVSNNDSGQVSAGYFNPANGTLGASCTSNVLTGFGVTWFNTGGLATQLNTGLGSLLYVAEDGNPSSVAEIVPQKGTAHKKGVQTCSLTELQQSPVGDANSTALRSIGVFPPRLF